MIINAYKNEEDEIFGDVESVSCTIKTDDAKLFHILSNLYSRPLDATVRELCTNCLDGHKVVGKENIPFIINVNDNKLEDEFNITFRDFGPGMDKNTIVKVFSRFGESTKINSNLETGCLGLGSKSPFSISDNFMVISYINNIKYIYNMSKDASGRPKITLFNESYTAEKNGMEIRVPLNPDRFGSDSCFNAIEKELKHFKIKPVVFYNQSKKELFKNKSAYTKIAHNSYIVKNAKTNSDYAIQGSIGYSLNMHSLVNSCLIDETVENFTISKNNTISNFTKQALLFMKDVLTFDLFFNMGEITFAPSREELIYDKITTYNVVSRYVKLFKILMDKSNNLFTNNKPFLFTNVLISQSNNHNTIYNVILDNDKENLYRTLNNKISLIAFAKFFVVKNLNDKKAKISEMCKIKFDDIEVQTNTNLYYTYNTHSFITKKNLMDDEPEAKFSLIRFEKNGAKVKELCYIRTPENYSFNKIHTLQHDFMSSCYILIDDIKIKSKNYKKKIEYFLENNNKYKVAYLLKYSNCSPKLFKDIHNSTFGYYGIRNEDMNFVDFTTLVNPPKVTIKDISSGKDVVKEPGTPAYRFGQINNFAAIDGMLSTNHFQEHYKMIIESDNSEKLKSFRKRNYLYIPLDYKNKSRGSVSTSILNAFKKHKIPVSENTSNLDLGSCYKYFSVLDELCKIRYNSKKNFRKITPMFKKTILIMNAEKAEKLGIRSFDSYLERFYKKLMDFKKTKPLIIHTSDDYFRRFNSILFMFEKTISNKQLMNIQNRAYDNKKALLLPKMLKLQKIVNTKFGDIFSKFHTDNAMIKDYVYKFNNQDKMLFKFEYLSYSKLKEIFGDNVTQLTTDDISKNIVDEFSSLGSYLMLAMFDSYEVDTKIPGDVELFISKINKYLVDIDRKIILQSLESSKSFMEPTKGITSLIPINDVLALAELPDVPMVPFDLNLIDITKDENGNNDDIITDESYGTDRVA